MVANRILPVIMAGGSGTRLWPLSRQKFPKQFLPLADQSTMLQATLLRLAGMPCDKPMVICGEDHRFTVAEQLRQSNIDHSGIILEPAGRNTAPAIALAALQADNDPVLLVLAADHVITDVAAFQQAVTQALPLAEEGKLVTFGIVPTGPETGYGYINAGTSGLEQPQRVEQFVEKPDLATAQSYLKSGNYFWNSGMFMFRASSYLQELNAHRPDIFEVCQQAMNNAQTDSDFVRADREIFLSCPSDSIDYAVMEKTSDAFVIPVNCGWSDVGSWSALWEIAEKDGDGNAASGDVLLQDCRNCLVRGDGKLVAAVGLENIVVVDTDDAVLIASQDRVQDVKKIVDTLKDKQREEASVHRKVYRPWGFYDSIDNGDRFQVKRIVVNPGAELSLQMHHHRAEHWVVVSGTAWVTKGEEQFLVSENQSTYIPIGEKHRLHNPGAIPLEMIEVQSGSYLGEDDIVRFEDNYGRADDD